MESRRAASLPLSMTDLTMQSIETIALRTSLIAQNQCSMAEYQQMVSEKVEAATESWMTLMIGGGCASMDSLLAPWSTRVSANNKRLHKNGTH